MSDILETEQFGCFCVAYGGRKCALQANKLCVWAGYLSQPSVCVQKPCRECKPDVTPTMPWQVLRLDPETLLTDQSPMRTLILVGRSGTRSYCIDWSRCEFRPRANRTKDLDGATIAAAPTSGIDAMSIVARDHASAFVLTARCKAATLTRRALRIFCATHSRMDLRSFRGDILCALSLAVATCRNEP